MNTKRIPHGALATPVLIAVIAGIAFCGAGIFTGVVHSAAAIFLTTALIMSFRATCDDDQHGKYKRRFALAALLILACLFLTLVPLPQWLDWTRGQDRAGNYEHAREALKSATTLPGLITPDQAGRAFAFTYNRAGTLRATMLFCAMVGAFMLAARVNGKHLEGAIWALTILAAAIAIIGYLSRSVWPQGYNLWWLFPVHRNPVPPIGGFMNRNHFGGYLALLAPLTIGLFLKAVTERRASASIFAAMLLIVAILGVIISHSRGALSAVIVGFAVALTAYGMIVDNRRGLWLMIPAMAAVLVVAWFFLPTTFTDRFAAMLHPSSDTSIMMRINTWRDTLRVFFAYPFFGVGANALGMIYPQFRISSHGGLTRYSDNDYLQALAECGVVGAILGIVLLALFWRCYRANRASYSLPGGLEAGLLGTLGAVAFHSLIDVPMRIPLYSITAAACAGFLISQSVQLPVAEAQPRPRRRLTDPVLALSATCLLTVALSAPLASQIRRLEYPVYFDTASLPELAHALHWSPTYSLVWFNIGHEVCNMAGKPNDARYRFGLECMARATELDPNNYRFWEQLGYAYLHAGRNIDARRAFARAKQLRPWLGVPDIPGEEAR